MKKSFFTLIILTFIFTGCGAPSDKKAELDSLIKQQKELTAKINKLKAELSSSKTDSNTMKAVSVEIATVEETPFVNYIKVQGKIDSDNNIMLSAKSAGTITNVYVDEGQSVSKGQVLAQIDSDILESNMAELQSSIDLATTLFERQQNLWDQNIGTEVQYLQAKNRKESLEQKMSSLKEQLQLTKIIAPFSGIVDDVQIKEGEVAAPGMPAIRVVNASDYKITADIAENYITSVKADNKTIIELPTLQENIVSEISTVSRVIDPVNRTFSVEVNLPDSLNKYVKANMIVYINIENYRNADAVVIPVNAVHFSDEGEFVFVAKNNKAQIQEVETGKVYNNNVEILSGLKAGDKIVVTGHKSLVDKQPILDAR